MGDPGLEPGASSLSEVSRTAPDCRPGQNLPGVSQCRCSPARVVQTTGTVQTALSGAYLPFPSKNVSTFHVPNSELPTGILIPHVLLEFVVVENVDTVPFGCVARNLIVPPAIAGDRL